MAAKRRRRGPDDAKWGWAAGIGVQLNAPMIGPGDCFQANAIYSKGAIHYAAMSGPGGNNFGAQWNGSTLGVGFAEDATFSGTLACTTFGNCPVGNSIQLTTAWSVFASYEHFWTPALRTSLYGSYLDVSRNDAGNFNACIGTGMVIGASVTGLAGSGFISPLTPCNANWQVWSVGSRSQWNVTKDFYVGVDVIYSKLNTMDVATVGVPGGATFLAGANLATAKPPGFYTFNDQDQVSVTWRVHRDIVP